MAQFDLKLFLTDPTLEKLNKCRTADLHIIADHFEVPAPRPHLKADLKAIVLAQLVANDLITLLPVQVEPPQVGGVGVGEQAEPAQGEPPQVEGGGVGGLAEPAQVGPPQVEGGAQNGAESPVSSVGSSLDAARLKVRLTRLRLEAEDKANARKAEINYQLELHRIEAETSIKMRQLELEAQFRVGVRVPKVEHTQLIGSTPDHRHPEVPAIGKPDALQSPEVPPRTRLQTQEKPEPSVSSAPVSTFDVSRHIALVPPFRESEVECYFNAFERIAAALHWPQDIWPLLLQCKLTGKAQEACAALSIEDSLKYDVVKSAILRTYELVPEAYRQRFRGQKKTATQTFVEFAREKSTLFDRWCLATKTSDFSALRELMLLEEFKNCVPERTMLYLNEQKVTTLQEAAVLADEYALTHKSDFSGKRENAPKREPHQKTDDSQATRSKGSPSSPKSERKCFFCLKAGHGIAECYALKRKQQSGQNKQPKGVGLIKTVPIDSQLAHRPVGPDECFKPFIFEGQVSLTGKAEDQRTVKILRDTGGSQSFVLSGVLPLSGESSCGASTIVQGIEMGCVPSPLHHVHVQSDLVTGFFRVAVRHSFPIPGVDFIMGNDIAGGKVRPVPEVVCNPEPDALDALSQTHPEVFSVSVLTRAQARKQAEDGVNLADSMFAPALREDKPPPHKLHSDNSNLSLDSPLSKLPVTRESLINAQQADTTLSKCFAEAVEASEVRGRRQSFYLDNRVLMRKWISRNMHGLGETDNDWGFVHQVVVPTDYRRHVLELAHDHPWSGHLGITKTYDRILKHFFWPGLKAAVTSYCKTCSTCQVTGKPNQVVPPAPLCPIPAVGEPFEHVIVDCVGPLPKTKSGNQFLLTIMCLATRFPEAIPLRKITALTVTKALTKFFTTFGLPKICQTDRGTNFMSKVFKQTLQSLGITHVVSSAYHPESQGALERWHQTLKSMLRKYCLETEKSWDEGLPFLLFAIREAKQESLGFSPAELVFGHSVRGPLKVLKEQFMSIGPSPKTNVLDFVTQCRERLHHACSLAKATLSTSQGKMKRHHDRKAVERSFQPGDQVLVLLPVLGSSLSARFSGPYTVKSKVSDTDYVIHTPERKRQTRLCHINMLKLFHSREDTNNPPEKGTEAALLPDASVSLVMGPVAQVDEDGLKLGSKSQHCGRLSNSEILSNLDTYLSYLGEGEKQDVKELILAYPSLFGDVPSRTTVVAHDVNVGDAPPIKQHPYRCPLAKREMMKKEVEYLLENGLAKPSHSPWSSPCLLTPKADGSTRFCTDYRRVNAVTVPDSFPLPRMEDCVDNVGSAVYITKLDLLKGYWQVPLTPQASDISAFVTPDHFLQYTVMPFGMRNAPATFQRLMNTVLGDVPNCNVYLDDVVLYSYCTPSVWEEHMRSLSMVFDRLAKASLTLTLAKCEFAKATVTYLGKQVGHGQVRPVDAKVAAILAYPEPTTRRELRRFLGMAGYYRCFCKNFSVVVSPLTKLSSPKQPFVWTEECKHAFEGAKSLLCSAPVLAAPDFSRPFTLEVDASASGAGGVLLQLSQDDIDHPVCYFSAKFKKHQLGYSTIEKETLALLLALQHFDVYVGSSPSPVTVYTDHNPLVFLARMYNHNQRLMRWALLAQDYNLDIRHKKGADNIVADALSREWE